MIYEVGDKVRIRKDLEVGKEYNDCSFTEDMTEFLGKEVTITYIGEQGEWYEIEEDEQRHFWSNEMIEGIERKSKAKLLDLIAMLIEFADCKDDVLILNNGTGNDDNGDYTEYTVRRYKRNE